MTKFIINPANENEILSIEGCRDEIEKLIGENDERKKKLLKIINHYGINNQQRKLAEEVFELQEAIINYELKASVEYEIPLTEIIGSKEHIIEEMADCMVLLSQFKEYYGISEKELQEVAKCKIERQLERISKESLNTTPDAQIYLMDRYRTFMNLDKEVEIIKEPKKIEKITVREKTLGFQNGEWTARNMDKAFAIKINELIDEINNLKENKYE